MRRHDGPGTERSLVLVVAQGSPASALQREVESLGFRSLVAEDAASAVDAAVEHRPEVCVIADSPEPGATRDAEDPGLRACRGLKHDPRTSRLPVIVLTATDDALSHRRATDAGADDVLATEHHATLLDARIRTLLRLRRATDALDDSARRLRELEKVRDDLMKMIVHDLKTPLTSILATLEILADGDLGNVTGEQTHAVQDMTARGNELLQLIDDLLQVWRIESTTIPLKPEEMLPGPFLEELVREWEYRFRQERADVHVDVASDARQFRADKGLIRRVFGNLLQNALTHAPAPVTLRLSAHSDRRGVLFTVADSGPGIPREYQEVIFRTFHRLPRPDESTVRGSGLGLAFCRLAVEAHGGQIWVQSEVGHGSAFHVLLPLDPAVALMRRAWNL